MSTMPILLADLKEIMTAIVPLVILVFWILSQVFGQKGAQPKHGKPAGNPRPRPEAGGLKAEIERFLQEAKQQQQKSDAELRPEPAAEQRHQEDREENERQERRRRKQQQERRRQERQRDAARERARESAGHHHETTEAIVDAQEVGAYPEAAQEISPYQTNDQFIEKASHLGESIDQTDNQLASHLHQVFDHQLGSFADSPDAGKAREAKRKKDLVTVNEITAMLRNPSNFRQAIILKEILDRPESRWS